MKVTFATSTRTHSEYYSSAGMVEIFFKIEIVLVIIKLNERLVLIVAIYWSPRLRTNVVDHI